MASVEIDGVAHKVSGAQVAVVRDGRVLIQLRPFPPGWELPGGHIDDEHPTETAVREVEEECGVRVRLHGVVGVYSWTGIRDASDVVYLGSAIGGRRRWSIEAWATRWVTPEGIPRTAFPWTRARVADALRFHGGAPPVHRYQHIGPVHVALFGGQWARAIVDVCRRWLGRARVRR